MSVDLARAGLLLRIVHDSSATPALSNISGLAMTELVTMNDQAGKDLAKAREEAQKKADEAKAKADAEAADSAPKDQEIVDG